MDQTPARGQARRAILDAAARQIALKGAQGLSGRAVARSAGVTHASVTHHFGDKDGLLRSLGTEGFEILANALEDTDGPAGSEDSARVYLEFALAHPGHFTAMFAVHLDGTDAQRATAEDRVWRSLLGGTPRSQAGPGGIARWSMVHGLASLWTSGALPAEVTSRGPAAVAGQVARALERGLATPPR